MALAYVADAGGLYDETTHAVVSALARALGVQPTLPEQPRLQTIDAVLVTDNGKGLPLT